jgi:hypothetical protein
MKRMVRWMAVLMMGWSGTVGAGDILTLTTGTQYEGIFDGYKNGGFAINIERGPVKKEAGSRVRKLVLASPCKTSVILQGGKNPQSLRLLGYEKSTFQFDQEGQPVTYPLSKVKEIQVEIDFSRVEDTSATEATVLTQGNDVELSTVIQKGVVNVLHIHGEGLMQSERVIEYLNSLPKKSENKGKVVILRADLRDMDNAFCEKKEIKSLPQFWFYNKRGELTDRLVERFTPADIDAALKKAKR